MRASRSLCASAALAILVTMPAAADSLQSLSQDAETCSAAALKTYAVATCETAEAIMNAALAKCRKQWSTYVGATVAAKEADPQFKREMAEAHANAVKAGVETPSGDPARDAVLNHMKMEQIYEDAALREFRADHQTDVFDARVENPNNACMGK